MGKHNKPKPQKDNKIVFNKKLPPKADFALDIVEDAKKEASSPKIKRVDVITNNPYFKGDVLNHLAEYDDTTVKQLIKNNINTILSDYKCELKLWEDPSLISIVCTTILARQVYFNQLQEFCSIIYNLTKQGYTIPIDRVNSVMKRINVTCNPSLSSIPLVEKTRDSIILARYSTTDNISSVARVNAVLLNDSYSIQDIVNIYSALYESATDIVLGVVMDSFYKPTETYNNITQAALCILESLPMEMISRVIGNVIQTQAHFPNTVYRFKFDLNSIPLGYNRIRNILSR